MQHGFDLQREITQPDNVHFLRDNNGPYVKIYYNDNKEYELFDHHNQQEVFMNNVDMFNYMPPNTQTNQMQFQPMNQGQNFQNKNSNSVIHHLVTSNIGPGKFEFGTYGTQNNSNTFPSANSSSTTSPLNISIPTLVDHVKTQPSTFGTTVMINENRGASSESSSPIIKSPTSNTAQVNNNNKKTRIVAEVKPMRMSYSDVVSKNAINNNSTPTSTTPPTIGQTNSASSSPNTTMPIVNKTKKYTPSNSFEKKQQENSDRNRKSPTNPIIINTNPTVNETKRNQPIPVKAEKPTTAATAVPTQPQQTNSKPSSKRKQQAPLNQKTTRKGNDQAKNQDSKHTTDSEGNEEDSSMIDTENEEDSNGKSEYYDIRKNVYQGEHHKVEKIKATGYGKKSKSIASSSAKKTEKGQKRVSAKVSSRKHKNEFLQKIFASCIEYLYIFVKWLWLLIYDVSYLSFGIIWDRIGWIYQCGQQGVSYVRRELSGNPGLVLIVWIKNQWKKFDSRFDKKSRWAFWRWMFKKQSGIDNAKDYYKDGKLPKTAEEAMKSLLNCKEKDAYR